MHITACYSYTPGLMQMVHGSKPGLPLRLTGIKPAPERLTLARSTVAQVYALRLLADLNFAENNLPANNGSQQN